LMAAVLGGKSSSVRELLARGADPELPNRDGMTPLQAAAFQNQRDVIEALIEGGAVVEVRRCNNAYHISPDLVV
jgi:ankyrin repeat protein